MLSLSRLLKSFHDAGQGLKFVFKSEQNFRVQIFIAVITFSLAIIFPLYTWEIVVIMLLILLVLVMEILNTAMEQLNDLLKPRLHHYVRVVKDIMAGAVFLTSLTSLMIGLIIFLPHFINLLK
jgi:diacylglycerol kinase